MKFHDRKNIKLQVHKSYQGKVEAKVQIVLIENMSKRHLFPPAM